MRINIRKDDTVKVITGRDAGKEGRVLRVLADKGKVLVEHVRIAKKNVRPNPQRNIKGGIAEQETPIAVGNVMLVCPSCSKPTRIGFSLRGRQKGARVPRLRVGDG